MSTWSNDLLGALAAQVFVGDGGQSEVAGAQLAEVVALVGLDDVALQHGVVGDAGQRDAVVGENVLVVLGVLQHLLALGRLEPGLQPGQHLVARQLVGDAGGGVGERDVAGFAGRDRQRNADDAGGEGIEAGGFGIERGQFGGFRSWPARRRIAAS
jgi:hypothetical protein